MGIFKSQKLSREDLSLSFGAVAFPIHVWAIINILVVFPAWMLRFSIGELAGAIGYPMAAALIESCVLWVILVILSLALPMSWLAGKFIALSSILAWLLAAWAVLAHYIYSQILQWGSEQILPGVFLVVVSLGLVYWLVRRYQQLEIWIKKIVQALSVLTYVYIFFDLIGLIVIVVRNI